MVGCAKCKTLENSVKDLENNNERTLVNLQNLLTTSDLAIMSLKEQLDEKTKKYEECKKLSAAHSIKLAELDDELARSRASKKAEEILATQVAELQQKIKIEVSGLRQEMESLQRDCDEKVQKSAREVTDLRSELTKTEQNAKNTEQNLRNELSQAKSSNSLLEEKVRECDEKLKVAKAEEAKLKAEVSELRELRRELDLSKEKVVALETKMSDLKRSKDSLLKDLQASEASKSALQARLDKVQSEGRILRTPGPHNNGSVRRSAKRKRLSDVEKKAEFVSPPQRSKLNGACTAGGRTTKGEDLRLRPKMTVPLKPRDLKSTGEPPTQKQRVSPTSIPKEETNNKTVVCLLTGFKDGTSYPNSLRQLLGKRIQELGGRISRTLGHSVSHIIGPVKSRTPKYLAGCLTGRWIMSPEWVTASFQQKSWEPEANWGKRFLDHPLKSATILVAPAESFKEKSKQVERQQHLKVLPTLFEKLCNGKIIKGVRKPLLDLEVDIYLGPGGCSWDKIVQCIRDGQAYSGPNGALS